MRIAPLVVLVVGFAGADAVAHPSSTTTGPTKDKDVCEESFGNIADEPLEPTAANALYERVQNATDSGCGARAFAWLLESKCASAATGVVAAAAFSSDSFRIDRMDDLLSLAVENAEKGELACAHQLLPAVQQAARVDEGTRAALLRATRSRSEALSDAGWLVLGTAGSIARRNNTASPLAESIDTDLDEALVREPRRIALLEAAGNAGCRACEASLAGARRDDDVWVRRAAVGASRFLPNGAQAMCAARHDSSPTVRDHAKWAIAITNTTCDEE